MSAARTPRRRDQEDELRDRIAEAIARAQDAAQAVIDDLGLTVEERTVGARGGVLGTESRVVGRWE